MCLLGLTRVLGGHQADGAAGRDGSCTSRVHNHGSQGGRYPDWTWEEEPLLAEGNRGEAGRGEGTWRREAGKQGRGRGGGLVCLSPPGCRRQQDTVGAWVSAQPVTSSLRVGWRQRDGSGPSSSPAERNPETTACSTATTAARHTDVHPHPGPPPAAGSPSTWTAPSALS